MDLILWRHADAQDGTSDMDRELTEKGRKQAEVVGRWLEARLPPDSRVLVSPAVRAQQTAMGLGRSFETLAEIAPGANVVDVLTAAGWPDTAGTVVVVGHQPTLGEVMAYLLFDSGREFTIKKGGLVWLTSRTRRGDCQVVLKAAMTPELV